MEKKDALRLIKVEKKFVQFMDKLKHKIQNIKDILGKKWYLIDRELE